MMIIMDSVQANPSQAEACGVDDVSTAAGAPEGESCGGVGESGCMMDATEGGGDGSTGSSSRVGYCPAVAAAAESCGAEVGIERNNALPLQDESAQVTDGGADQAYRFM